MEARILLEKRTICTTPPGCHNGCGIIALVRNGRVTEIRGDRANPFNRGALCPRGAALPRTVHHPDRVLHPLRKTRGGWKGISWEEALDTVAGRFLDARERSGARSVIFCKGTGRDTGPWLSRLALGFGSPEYYALGPGSGSACLMPRMSVCHSLFGGWPVADCSQYFRDRYDDPRWVLPRCLLIWGSNPVDSNPDGFLGQWIVECLRRGTKMIVVDPRKTWMARRADIHLPVAPGTDAVLAMAFLNVLFERGMVDRDFARRFITGIEDVRGQVEPYTPEKAGETCGIRAELIEAAAVLYGASKPAAVHWGVSVDMSPSALGTAHALASLMALSGNIDIPGGNVIVTDPFGISRRGISGEHAAGLLKTKTGVEEYPMTGMGYPYAHADTLLDEIEAGRQVECAWYQGTGITANGFAEPRRAGTLLKRTGFSVVTDLFMSPAADELADVFLPVCTCLERRGIRNWWYQLAAFDRVIEPLGESRSDMEIVLRAGKLMAPEHFPWSDVTGWFDHVLEPSGYSWSELEAIGWLMPGTEYRKGFATPSGRIELQPGIMARAGLLPAPWYSPPPSEGFHPGYPLKLTTGARTPVYFHGEHRNVPELSVHEPLPTVEIHPDDIPRGITPGSWVRIESPWGFCLRVLSPSPLIKRGVLSASHGWRGEGLNVNDLLDSDMQGRGGLGYPFRCLPCRVSGPAAAPEGFQAPKTETTRVIRRVNTLWCTGCRACAVACRMHTGLTGIAVEMVDGEWTPGFTSLCLNCPDAPCVAACHTGCLEGDPPVLGFRTSGLREVPLEEALRGIKDAGYQAVEFCMEHPGASPEALRFAGGLGLRISSVSYHGKRDPADKRLAMGRRAIELACAAGVSVVVFGSPLDHREGFLEETGELYRMCRDRGIMPAWETEPGTILDSLSEWQELIAPLGPLAGINLDAGHLHLQGSLSEETLEALGGRIHHVHIEGMNMGSHTHLLPGEGDLDWDVLLRGLRRAGYRGPLVIDLFHLPADWRSFIVRAKIAASGIIGYSTP